ncbi:FtsX-like permease family protein [Rhodocytophaga rosea]|uniref:FtsX-like permease family protein n=1 Tax=Rhodocytophaga rosea TaxID=2704465 RepID=A0A6C0GSC6_9BACT|nr:ABC transporter permease [Rhodocytophaga rosea]QHT70847.1 FtsX-like permease family protein [Rhodocytophaga rosea]
MIQDNTTPKPPQWASWLLKKFCAPHLLEEIEQDLEELYETRIETVGIKQARYRYVQDVVSLLRPFILKRKPSLYPSLTLFDMITNYFKISLRQLLRNKVYSFINIGGLCVGMAVAMLIGLWVNDELSFNQYHQNYDHIIQVLENEELDGGIETFSSLPMPLSHTLRTDYKSDFKYVVATTWHWEKVISYGDQKLTMTGRFAEAGFPEMITLHMYAGSPAALTDPSSVLISQSLAYTLFGESDPIDKMITLGNQYTLQIKGVYEDLPRNSTFHGMDFIAPIEILFPGKEAMNNWQSSSFQILGQLQPNSNLAAVSAKITDVLYQHNQDRAKPSLFLHPMHKWHLYAFKNGIYEGGRIEYVYLFSLIGGFVLLLACINFMNLSTARSQKRAREVGIRKAIGSLRRQLINQFLSESVLVAFFAFVLSLLLLQLVLPPFNDLADKEIRVVWTDAYFWIAGICFTLLTGLLAGSYPALYLSSFNPVKVLKGTFGVGERAAIPRKILVVVQFTVSVSLIISTLLVYTQIEFAKNRPIGYNREGLVNMPISTPEMEERYEAIRNELSASGAVAEIALSSSSITEVSSSANNLDWQGKDPNRQALFGTVLVTPDFGKVVGWKIKEGRDFSRAFSTDSLAFLLNEAAVKLTGLKNPVGETIRWHDKNWKVIGVVKDMVMESPYEPVRPIVFFINNRERMFNSIHIKLNPSLSSRGALSNIERVMKKHNLASSFEYRFADLEYAKKFAAEERIGTLAAFFATLAIFISCLGLFGLASYTAEQRRKEIGIRKVLGASVFNVWALLSKDFVGLVMFSILIASPLAYYFIDNWLEKYEYRTPVSLWIFVAAGFAALAITLITVSFQALKAALMNPVRSLRNE